MEVAQTNPKVKRYLKIAFLGEGQFATVYKAEDLETNTIVAIKKIKLGKRAETRDGINRTALREIKLLKELENENIIGLLDVFFGHNSNVSLVFDFMDTDLEKIIQDSNIILTAGHIKKYMLMTLQGMEYLHSRWVLHRDIKPNNLLLNRQGVLKITDFGLAKAYASPSRNYTHQVVTRWYRCPELLYGAMLYGTGVDIWATGCILAELFLRVPFLQGDNDIAQLYRIFEVFGSATEEVWPGVTNLPSYIEIIVKNEKYNLSDIFTAASDDTIQLLEYMLMLNPAKRCTATEALKSTYFSRKPAPTASLHLPLPQDSSSPVQADPLPPDPKKRSLEEGRSSVAKKLKY